MMRTLPATRQVVRSTRLPNTRLLAVRRFATETTPVSNSSPEKKKGRFTRRLLTYTAVLVTVFYAASPPVAFNNERYHAFFSESVPFGQTILDYAEDNDWDRTLRVDIFGSPKDKLSSLGQSMKKTIGPETTAKAVEKAGHVKDIVLDKALATNNVVTEKYKESRQAVQSATGTVVGKGEKNLSAGSKEKAQKAISTAQSRSKDGASVAKEKGKEVLSTVQSKVTDGTSAGILFSEGVEELVRKAEAALSGKPIDKLSEATTPSQTVTSPPDTFPSSDKEHPDVPLGSGSTGAHVYTADLPLGFEVPPGYSKPRPPTKETTTANNGVQADAKPDILPLVAPVVAELTASEPVIVQLASTIDNLASLLNSSPTATPRAHEILDTARVDLTELAGRMEKVKEEEREKLEAKLDDQTREYRLKLLELEMEAQDKLDGQEQEFKDFFEEERRRIVHAYREKLENELRTQSDIINERLKEEVIAQGIELQRRWIREIKVRVEQERGGRLAKLDELAVNLKRLERITLDNSTYLDENIRLHGLWSALRALHSAVDSPVRRPFRDELRVLRHIVAAREDPVIASVLSSLEASDVPDVGIEPLAALSSWFSTSVSPQVTRVALVPEQNAGVLSHLASYLISSFRFQRHGLVEGNDVISVLARAEYYMNEKDLDNAARELNQLKGASKVLLDDWLAAARRRLEVLQALEVVETQATLASLLVI